jgi:hypothetical protein
VEPAQALSQLVGEHPERNSQEASRRDVAVAKLSHVLVSGRFPVHLLRCTEQLRRLASVDGVIADSIGDRSSSGALVQSVPCLLRRRSRIAAGSRLEPRLLPDQEAFGLAATVGRSVAAEVLEVDGIAHPTSARLGNRVAQLLGPLRDHQLPTGKGKHLRHEREPVERAVVVQRRKDLLGGAQDDAIAAA